MCIDHLIYPTCSLLKYLHMVRSRGKTPELHILVALTDIITSSVRFVLSARFVFNIWASENSRHLF